MHALPLVFAAAVWHVHAAALLPAITLNILVPFAVPAVFVGATARKLVVRFIGAVLHVCLSVLKGFLR